MSSFSSILTAAFIYGASPVLIFFLTLFVKRTVLLETSVPRYLIWITPVFLVGWFLSANFVGYFAGLSGKGPLSPAGLVQMFLPMLMAILVLFLSKPVIRLLKKMPLHWLIFIQAYRIEGILFLYLYFHDHFLSRGFALTAGTGDMLVGISALLVARWVRTRGRGYVAAAIIWNIAGITDLLMAPISARLSGFQGIISYPLVLVPLFLGPPLGIFLHISSLRNIYLSRGAGKL